MTQLKGYALEIVSYDELYLEMWTTEQLLLIMASIASLAFDIDDNEKVDIALINLDKVIKKRLGFNSH